MSRFEYRRAAEPALARQAGVVAAVERVTRRVEQEAVRGATPVSRRLADGIDSSIGVDERGVVGRVNAHWWGSLFVEFGTKNQAPHPVLRQALDSVRGRR